MALPFSSRSVADPGCLSRIPGPTFFHPESRIRIRILSIPDPGFRIRIKEFKYFNPKNCFLSSRKYDPGCSSRIRIPEPDPDFLPIPDPRSRGQKGTGSRIPDLDPQHCLSVWQVENLPTWTSRGKRVVAIFNDRIWERGHPLLILFPWLDCRKGGGGSGGGVVGAEQ